MESSENNMKFQFHFQKQSFADVLQNRCFQKFRKFRWKTPVLESLFSEVAGLLGRHGCFPVKFVKLLRTSFFTEHLRWLLLHFTFCLIKVDKKHVSYNLG